MSCHNTTNITISNDTGYTVEIDDGERGKYTETINSGQKWLFGWGYRMTPKGASQELIEADIISEWAGGDYGYRIIYLDDVYRFVPSTLAYLMKHHSDYSENLGSAYYHIRMSKVIEESEKMSP
jgi:hypothetical protein